MNYIDDDNYFLINYKTLLKSKVIDNLKLIPLERHTYELYKYAVTHNGMNLKYVASSINQYYQLCKIAIDNNIYAIKYVDFNKHFNKHFYDSLFLFALRYDYNIFLEYKKPLTHLLIKTSIQINPEVVILLKNNTIDLCLLSFRSINNDFLNCKSVYLILGDSIKNILNHIKNEYKITCILYTLFYLNFDKKHKYVLLKELNVNYNTYINIINIIIKCQINYKLRKTKKNYFSI